MVSNGRKDLLGVTAVDPGGHTGVVSAIVPLRDGLLAMGAVEALDRARSAGLTHRVTMTQPLWQAHVEQLVRAVRVGAEWVGQKASELGYAGWGQAVVIEGFSGGEGEMTSDVWSPIKIGACMELVFPDLVVYQDPSQKGQITDNRLRLWTWYSPGQGHVNDAVRHLFVYLRALERSPFTGAVNNVVKAKVSS